MAWPAVSKKGQVENLEENLIEKNIIADFFGETKAEERHFAHIEAMIKTFMNPIDEMEEDKEEDTPAQPSMIYEPEIRLQFDEED